MITAAEQRYRKLFQTLDDENEWPRFLTSSQIQYVRLAAESEESWLSFLAGVRHNDGDVNTEDLSAKEVPQLSEEEVWNASAIVRKRVTFAAIDEDYFPVPRDDREDDYGIMPGDDGGYTNYEQLRSEEMETRKQQSGVYKLFGYQGNNITEMPKPLFGQRVTEMLKSVKSLKELCEENSTLGEAFAKMVKKEAHDEFSSVEECVSAVNEFVKEYREALGNRVVDVKKAVANLRKDYDEFAKSFAERIKTTDSMKGILGVNMPTKPPMDYNEDSGAPARRLPYYESCVEYRSSGKRPCTSIPKRPRAPTFANGDVRQNDGKSLWEILGRDNPVVKNLVLYERVMKMKKEMLDLQERKSGTPMKVEPKEEVVMEKVEKPDMEIIKICDESDGTGNGSRIRSMGESAVSLLLSHAGFSHSVPRALELLTDVFEKYLKDVGKQLISCRENIDNNAATVAEYHGRRREKTRDELLIELELICSGVRGGFPEISSYIKYDLIRTESALREVEMKMGERIEMLRKIVNKNAEVEEEELDGSDPVAEEDVRVDCEGFKFGYLGKRVWLDVLGGIEVPVEIAFRQVKDEVELMNVEE